MTYRYISEVMDGARRLLRMLPGNVHKTEYRREAAFAGNSDGDFRRHGSWNTIPGIGNRLLSPKMEARISKSDWAAVLHRPPKALRAAGETPR